MPNKVTTRAVDPWTSAFTGGANVREIASHADALAALRSSRPATDDEEVPTGSPRAVLAWVGHDVERAKAALVAEQSRGQDKQRPSLVAALHERITG